MRTLELAGANARTEVAKVEARFRALSKPNFGILLPAARSHHKDLGLSVTQLAVLEQLLFHYREPKVWRSFGQEQLARELQLSRNSLNSHLNQVHRKGLLARRQDVAHGVGRHTYFYCLEPFLAGVAFAAAKRESDAERAAALVRDGSSWLNRFWRRLDKVRWEWDFGSLSAPERNSYTDVWVAFQARYGPPTTAARAA